MSRNAAKQSMYSGIMIAKMAVACAVSWQLAKLAGSTHPYLAPLSVIFCMQTTVFQTLRHSYHRIIGTVIGGSFIGILAGFMQLNNWTLGLLIFLGLWIAKVLRRNEVVSEQVALTVLLVFIFEHKTGHYLIDRFRDTAIGTLLAMIVHLYVFPPNFNRELRRALLPLSSQLAAWFDRTAAWVQTGCMPDEGTRLIREVKQRHPAHLQTEQTLQEMSKSLKMYPFSRGNFIILHSFQKRCEQWSSGFFYLLDAIYQIERWQVSGCMTETEQGAWARQFLAIASYFKDQNEKLDKNSAELPDPEFAYVEPVKMQAALPETGSPNPYGAALYQNTLAFIQKLE